MSETITSETLKGGGKSQKQVGLEPEDDFEKHEDGLVDAKYMGTLADRRDMSVLGKQQVLRVRKKAEISDIFSNYHAVYLTKDDREISNSFPFSGLAAP